MIPFTNIEPALAVIIKLYCSIYAISRQLMVKNNNRTSCRCTIYTIFLRIFIAEPTPNSSITSATQYDSTAELRLSASVSVNPRTYVQSISFSSPRQLSLTIEYRKRYYPLTPYQVKPNGQTKLCRNFITSAPSKPCNSHRRILRRLRRRLQLPIFGKGLFLHFFIQPFHALKPSML